MENVNGFNIDRLLCMLDAALTRQNEKQKAAITKITENKVDSNFPQLRRRIVTWMADLNEKFEFSSETLFLSVAVFDRFLVSVKAHPKYMTCIGIACFYLAAKTVEEDQLIPNTLTLVRSSECGCSVAEVLRMERCILDKLNWDLKLATSLDFLHIFHALLLAHCPKVLDEMKLSISQHVTRLVCQLQTCLLDSRLAGFAPATLALATLSLDLELFVGWHLWLPATVTLQTLAQVSGRDLVWCRELAIRLLVGDAVICGVVISADVTVPTCNKPSKRKVDDVVNDDFYDGIKRLYAEDGALSADVAATSTCAGQVLRYPCSLQMRDFVTRVNN